MHHTEDYDLQPKRKFKSADAAQLVFSAICLANAGYLCFRANCGHYEYFNYVLLIGSAIWVIYLLITLVVQFRDKGTRMLLRAMDWIFILFHMALFVWANVLYWRWENSCSKEWNFWVFTYLLFGYAGFFCLIAGVVMGVLRLINKNKYEKENPDYKFTHNDLPYAEMGQMTGDEFGDAYAMYD